MIQAFSCHSQEILSLLLVYIRQILDGIAAFAMLQLNLTRAYFREAFRHNSFFFKIAAFNKFLSLLRIYS